MTNDVTSNGMAVVLQQLAAVDLDMLQSVLDTAAQAELSARATVAATTPPTRRRGVTVLSSRRKSQSVLQDGLNLAMGNNTLQNSRADAEAGDDEGTLTSSMTALQHTVLATLLPEPDQQTSPTLSKHLQGGGGGRGTGEEHRPQRGFEKILRDSKGGEHVTAHRHAHTDTGQQADGHVHHGPIFAQDLARLLRRKILWRAQERTGLR